nr:Na-translocating system protein MpsC family protein [Gracilibacillus lacisalsi]
MKQNLMKQNNQVHQDIFKIGLIEQHVTLIENKIIIVSKNKRIPVLNIIYETSKDVSHMIERLVNINYKEQLEKKLVEHFDFDIEIVLRDYDPTKNMNVTIIILSNNITNYVTG